VNREVTSDAGLDASMLDWIGEVADARRLHVERRSAGASRAGYAVDAERADGSTVCLWLRMDTGAGPQSGGVYTLRREAAVYRALAGRGVRIAEVVAVHPTGEAFLMQRLEGRNWFSEVDDPLRQETLASRFMAQLAALHRVDVRTLDLPELGPVRRLSDHIADEIEIWDAQYRARADDEPLLELALSWLARHVPEDDDWPVVLVQGDTGPGNFMYRDDEIVAVTDWEMAHFGDVHDDLAWIYVRDLQERFTHLPDRMRDYEAMSGRRIDARRLRYFLVLAQTRCAIGTRNGLLARDSRGEMANHLIYSTLHLRMLAEALAAATGVPADAGDPIPRDEGSETTWMYDVALEDLRDVLLPALGNGFAARRAKGMARLLKYLREHERLGAAAEGLECAELADLLGHRVDDVRAGRSELCRAIARGAVSENDVLVHCLRQQARATEIAAPAMGALAERHYAPLPD
jgi:aminoglycoside phosphotransferase (APT) family kinase protein